MKKITIRTVAKSWIYLFVLTVLLPFPTINFVDELPSDITEQLVAKVGYKVIGTYTRNNNEIHIVKSSHRNSALVLVHELVHWQIYKLFLPDKVHKWFDNLNFI